MHSVVRWNPISNFTSVQDELTRVMEDVFGRRWRTDEAGAVALEDGRLVIRGEKTRTEEQKNATYHRVERVYGTFERSFKLNHAVQGDKVEATYRDGVLEVSVPKAEEAKAREIPIKTAR